MRHNFKKKYTILHSQNFIKKGGLSKKIVSLANLSDCQIIEIGPGTGSLTTYLLEITNNYVGVELDINCFEYLKANFPSYKFVNTDFLNFTLPSNKYCVIGNIPFNLTAEILEKILYATYLPEKCYLIMQSEASERLLAEKYNTFFSTKLQPFFTVKKLLDIPRFEFNPVPKVNAVFIEISKRSEFLLNLKYRSEFEKFLLHIYEKRNIDLKNCLKDIFSFTQLKKISSQTSIDFKKNKAELDIYEWLILFQKYLILSSNFNVSSSYT